MSELESFSIYGEFQAPRTTTSHVTPRFGTQVENKIINAMLCVSFILFIFPQSSLFFHQMSMESPIDELYIYIKLSKI